MTILNLIISRKLIQLPYNAAEKPTDGKNLNADKLTLFTNIFYYLFTNVFSTFFTKVFFSLTFFSHLQISLLTYESTSVQQRSLRRYMVVIIRRFNCRSFERYDLILLFLLIDPIYWHISPPVLLTLLFFIPGIKPLACQPTKKTI